MKNKVLLSIMFLAVLVVGVTVFYPAEKAAATDSIMTYSNPAAYWTSSNMILPRNILGYESDTGLSKIGDGATQWTSLPYTNLAGFYTAPTVSTTLTTGDCGKVIGVGTDALTHKVPLASAGCKFTFANIGAAGHNIISIASTSTGVFVGTCTSVAQSTLISSSSGSVLTNTKATAQLGDSVTLVSLGTYTYAVTGCTGTWATP